MTPRHFTRLNASRLGFKTSSGRGLIHLDHDVGGGQDIVVANHDGAFKIYETRASGGHWLQVDLKSAAGAVLGTEVYVTTEIVRPQPDRTG